MNPSSDAVSDATRALEEVLKEAPGPFGRILQAVYELAVEGNATLEHALNESYLSFTVNALVAKVVSGAEKKGKTIDAGRVKDRVLELARALEDRSFGQFFVGRRGHKSRYVLWPGAHEEDASILTAIWQRVAGKRTENQEKPPPSVATLEHAFQLRPGLSVKVQLPANLSRTEAARFARFLESLPFDAA